MLRLCNLIGHSIQAVHGEFGLECPVFCCLLFPEGAVGEYVTNGRREDIIKAIEEFLVAFKAREDVARVE